MRIKYLLKIIIKLLIAAVLVIITNSLHISFFDTNVDIFNISIKQNINWNLIYFLIFMRILSSFVTNYFKPYFKLSRNNL